MRSPRDFFRPLALGAPLEPALEPSLCRFEQTIGQRAPRGTVQAQCAGQCVAVHDQVLGSVLAWCVQD